MTLQQIVDLLNDAVKLDQEAIQALLRTTVPCNEALADHSSIVVWGVDETPENVIKVGLGGLLTGIAAIDGGVIASVWDTSDPLNPKLTGFTTADTRKPIAWVGEKEHAS